MKYAPLSGLLHLTALPNQSAENWFWWRIFSFRAKHQVQPVVSIDSKFKRFTLLAVIDQVLKFRLDCTRICLSFSVRDMITTSILNTGLDCVSCNIDTNFAALSLDRLLSLALVSRYVSSCQAVSSSNSVIVRYFDSVRSPLFESLLHSNLLKFWTF